MDLSDEITSIYYDEIQFCVVQSSYYDVSSVGIGDINVFYDWDSRR